MGSTYAHKHRIRPVSRETRFVRLRSLHCFQEVHEKLVDGWPGLRVATWIQQTAKEYTDVAEVHLSTLLNEYRASLPPTALSAKIPQVNIEAAARVERGLDELQELENLYKMQLERIQIDLQTEKKINKLIPSMTQEIRAGREILSDIAKLKMDLGLSKRHLGKLEVDAQVVQDVTHRYDETVGKTLADPESRRKLLGIAERFLSVAASKVGTELLAEKEPEAELEEAVLVSEGSEDGA